MEEFQSGCLQWNTLLASLGHFTLQPTVGEYVSSKFFFWGGGKRIKNMSKNKYYIKIIGKKCIIEEG